MENSENTNKSWRLSPKQTILLVILICAIGGAIGGVIITLQYSHLKTDKPAAKKPNNNEPNLGTGSKNTSISTPEPTLHNRTTPPTTQPSLLADPTNGKYNYVFLWILVLMMHYIMLEKYNLHLLAIGGWGAPANNLGAKPSTSERMPEKSALHQREYSHAQKNVADLMAQIAAMNRPKAVISHGYETLLNFC